MLVARGQRFRAVAQSREGVGRRACLRALGGLLGLCAGLRPALAGLGGLLHGLCPMPRASEAATFSSRSRHGLP